jgi:hypothetical protein
LFVGGFGGGDNKSSNEVLLNSDWTYGAAVGVFNLDGNATRGGGGGIIPTIEDDESLFIVCEGGIELKNEFTRSDDSDDSLDFCGKFIGNI